VDVGDAVRTSGPVTVVRSDCELVCPRIDDELRSQGVNLVLTNGGLSEERFVRSVREADLLLTCYQPVTAAVIAAAPRLRAIIKYGVGVDAIDIEAAKAQGIPVVNVPDYAEETVAEAAFAHMIALAKKVTPLQREIRAEGWAWPEPRWLGTDIAGKTVGLVGTGRIGTCMARMAGAGFRARVLGYDPFVSDEQMRNHGIEKLDSLDQLLRESDFVSLHATLTPESRHLIGEHELAQMRSTAFLINVSRGELVDEQALVAALTEGRIAGAGLDTYGQEPLTLTGHPLEPLFAMENVILLPHLAFYTEQAMDRLEQEVLERCAEALSGARLTVRSGDPRLASQVQGVVIDV